ncbi:RHS repeat-associated core domain-containing protein [Nonomuraea lactucae]|uniref:RHS repeat-associated core domain-containing protein n=1 Tax=Nonomuraea lactucae TaxID=2249762 RepID=UPI0013B473C9|nr:RHS repeat-associated core domain-containing protein [Nonomuraea lactucae]
MVGLAGILLPGLLIVQAGPAAAGVSGGAVVVAGLPDTPVQQSGGAAGLSPLVARETTATAAVTGAAPEKGWKSDPQPPKDVVPAERRSGPAPDQASTSEEEGLPSGVARAEAVDALAAAPSLVDVYPLSGSLVDGLRPRLRAWAESDSAVSYSFRVCDVESMSGSGCTSSGYVAGGGNAWQVPAGKLVWGRQYWWTVTARDSASLLTTTSSTLTFTTGVRQPAVTSRLAEQGPEGREFDPRTGNYTTSVTDVSVSAAGLPLAVRRTYNSMDPRRDGMFGAGWSAPWDMKIVRDERGGRVSALVTGADGRLVRFAAPDAGGVFQPPPGMQASLALVPPSCYTPPGVACPAGGTATWWHFMDKSATKYVFDDQGRLRKVIDSRSRAQDLSYGGDGKLATVTATGGRALHFTWSGGRVAQVSTDAVDGAPLTWTYSYEDDRLVRVCTPTAAPNCTSYAYGSGSQYRSRVLDGDPFAYWRLGEASGTVAADQSQAERHATYQSVTLGQPGALAATPDTAASFTTGSVLKLPSNIVSHLGDQVSLEMWFKTSASGVLVAAGSQQSNGAAHGPMLYVGTDGRLRGSLGTVTNPITTSGAVNDGAWHHVVLTASGASQALYLDGQKVGTLTGTVTGWRQLASVGNGVTDPAVSPAVPATQQAFPLQGAIDEVALYGQPLTEAEIGDHYAARAQQVHKLTQVTLPSGRVWAANTYDPVSDRLATHTDRHGGTWKVGALAVEVQSGESTVVVTDPANESLKFYYDAWRGYRPVGEVDQLGHTEWYNYDQAGFLQTITDRNNIDTRLYHDARGNVVARWYCRAQGECAVEFWSYHLNTSDAFDPRNDRMLAHRDGRSAGESDNTFATKWEYNAYGEQTKETTPATSDFPTGRSATIAYTNGSEPAIGGGTTPAGLAASKTDARGNTWTYRYTAAGDLAEQTNPEGLKTTLGYDPIGRPTGKTEISQAHPGGVATTFSYDGLSRPLTQTEPGIKNEITDVTHTKRTTYAYDADGNKLSEKISDLTGGDAERATVYTYDALGRPETVTDPEGGVDRQVWNSLGLLTRVTDARGTIIDHGYSKRGEPTSRTLKGWTGSPVNPQPATDVLLASFGYDPAGRLAAQTDAMGRKTTYTYWDDNQLSQKIADDAKLNGSATPRDVVMDRHEYDPAGNLITQKVGGDSVTTVFDYDAANRLTAEIFDPSALERVTAFGYDANDNVQNKTLTGAGTSRTEVSEYAYNKVNQLTKTTVDNGSQDLISTTRYDDRGLATATIDPRGNISGASEADFTSTLRYDALGRLVEVTGPQVQVDKAGTANAARPSVRYGYDTFGARTHESDAEGRTLTSVFDRAGRLTRKSAPAYTPPGGSAITPAITHAYDPAGQLIRTTDPRGNTSSFDYDQLGRRVRITDPAPEGQTAGRWVTEYDLAGEQVAGVDPTGARVEATYDDLGRRITETAVERKPSAVAYTTTFTYNDAGHLTKTVAPGNRTASYKPNAAGEVTEQTDPASNITKVAYDPAGRPTKVTDPLGNATTADYDLAGRKTAVKDLNASGAVLRTTSAGYDAAGNQTSLTSAEGHQTRQTFDALNRLTSLIEPVKTGESITTSFGYDATGARTRLTNGRGHATWTTYNSLGLAETVTEPATAAHPNAADRTWTHIYDPAGNPTAEIQPGRVRIDRTFDHLGRLTRETGGGGGAASAERTFGYDQAGRRTAIGDLSVDYNDRALPLTVKRGESTQTSYSYDSLGNPTQRIDAAGTATFTWDSAGRLETATDPVTTRKITYGYDAASRLTSMNAAIGATASDSQTFTYDALDRLATHTLKRNTGAQLAKITYGWDKDDNLTTKTTAGTAGAGTNAYTYDHAGRLTSWTAPGGATTAYEWDAVGNRTKAGTKTYTYDERNRLTSGDGTDYTYTPRGTLATQTKNGATTQLTFDAFDRLIADGDSLYSYDALDRVTTRIKGASKHHFAYAGLGNDLAALTDTSGAVQARYGRDPFGGLLGQQEDTNPALGTMSDLHGDLVATFTSTALATTTAYDPFGTVTTQTGAKANLGYQGEYTDPDTGKVNMHARWYQPGTGTFTSRDTATITPNPSVQANRYTYANASPLTGTDPTGHYTTQLDNPGNYSLGYDAQTVADTYAQYGLVLIGNNDPDGYVCGGDGICSETFVHQQWWNEFVTAPGYDYEHLPQFSDEEIKRLGYKVMPNGRPVEKDVPFYRMSAEAQRIYMQSYSPTLTYDENLWVAYAAMVEAGDMRKYAGTAPAAGDAAGCCMPRLPSWLRDFGRAVKRSLDKGVEYLKKLNPADLAELGVKTLTELLPGTPLWLIHKLVKMENIKAVEGAMMAWASEYAGGHCGTNRGMVMCTGMSKEFFPQGRVGYTIGGVFFTKLWTAEISDGLVEHEKVHRAQWYYYARETGIWFTFGILYLIEGEDPCTNKFERQAGLVRGGYTQC